MRSLLVVLVALVSGVGVPVIATTPAHAAAGERYVALGDSYAAGFGLTPTDTSPGAAACGRAATNYPHEVAEELGLDLVDVTCGGAVIGDFAGSQQTGGTTVPPQFDALSADTRLVTLTIGGNDLGFGTISSYCASIAGPDGPVLGGDGKDANCKAHFVDGGDDTLADTLTSKVEPDLTAALATIKQRSPQARIVVVDYPALVPDAAHTPSAGCWANPLQQSNVLPFTTTDVEYLYGIQAKLNQTLADVATRAGAGVASAYTASLAHTACGSSPWVNGVLVSGLSIKAGSLHPNAEGVAAVTAATVPVARTLLAGGTVTAPPPLAGSTADNGVPGWVWGAVAVGAALLVIVGFGAFRVVRRRR
ncbi:SGNH/GDSL hydrolase family protein [Jatrophihabitans sp. YIM 134969]